MSSQSFKDLENDFKFLILEIKKQLGLLEKVLEKPSRSQIKKIQERDDYIDNFRNTIDHKVFKYLHENPKADKSQVDLARSLSSAAGNLERIGDFCINIVQQLNYLQDHSVFLKYETSHFFNEIYDSLKIIGRGLFKRNINHALRVCKAEYLIDKFYDLEFQKMMDSMRRGEDIEDTLTTIFIFRYFERMGDALQNVGEAIIGAAIGEKLKVDHYKVLEEAIGSLPQLNSSKAFEYDAITNTWSGCRIGKIQQQDSEGQTQDYILKHGKLQKILDEKKNIEMWDDLVPGLPPKILQYSIHKESGSMLLECIKGHNFKEILLEEKLVKYQGEAFKGIKDVLTDVWLRTLSHKEIKPDFISQLNKRLEDVLSVHQDFTLDGNQIGNIKTESFNSLLKKLSKIEKKLKVPFTVLLHGDMNLDNFFFNPDTKHIHFIDLNRSRQGDFAQDVSVFLISNFRIFTTSTKVTNRLNQTALEFYNFAREFAVEHGDHTFDARLALGLIRSYVTSTRFQLNKEFASEMFLRANYLSRRLLEAAEEAPLEDFKLPKDLLEK